MISKKKLSYNHIVREPLIKCDSPPALFMLHGYGSNEQDLYSFIDELPKDFFIISVRAPYTIAYEGYAWFDIHFNETGEKWIDNQQAIACRDGLNNFISKACESYSLNTERISVIGFSQGAILGYALALSFPQKIKNLVALSGYLNTSIIDPHYKDFDFSTLSIYTSHGEEDQVIPLEWANKTPRILKSLHIEYLFETYPTGHTLTMTNIMSFRDWLKQRL